MELKLEDLAPSEATLTLSDKHGKIYTLKKFTLLDRIWVKKEFGSQEKAQAVFESRDLEGICKIAYHLLKDKTDFPKIDDFFEAIVTPRDQLNVIEAIVKTFGVSEPVIKELTEENTNPQ